MSAERAHELLYPFLYGAHDAIAARTLDDVKRSALQKVTDVIALRRAFIDEQLDALIAAAADMAARFRAGGRMLTFGCGGSATDAIDVAYDFACAAPPTKPLPTLSLAADPAVLTAIGNDVGFANVFLRQLIAHGRAGDIALGISTSGNSAALREAWQQARRQGMLTVAILGYDGGEALRDGCLDHALIVRADYVPRVQEAQATIYHTLRALVEAVP